MGRVAARVDDDHQCPLLTPTVHVGGPILPIGAANTLVEGKHAARVGDKAFCVAPAPDTVRGGLLTVFIEGSPASRIHDATDVGDITAGARHVELGELGGGPLNAFQAQWLYDYLASQRDIPFEYATDGCFARADRMSEFMKSLGIPVQKQWVFDATGGANLAVPIAGYPGTSSVTGLPYEGVMWRYHVAPVVPVEGMPGGAIIDPSMSPGGPISVSDWTNRMNPSGVATATSTSGPDVYYRNYDRRTGTWSNAITRDQTRTATDLNNYRNSRAALPASTGRNVPNAPVHY